jgi:hypothetical protein
MECIMTFFSQNHKHKPDPKKNFFQNYNDHLNSLERNFIKKIDTSKTGNYAEIFNSIKTKAKYHPGQLLQFATQEILAPLYVFDKLRDGHDYFDEVSGATVVPLLSAAAFLGFTTRAIWEGIQKLAHSAKGKYYNGDEGLSNLVLAGTALMISITSLIKSVISLVSRPLVTLLGGFQAQDTKRFYIETEDTTRLSPY